MEANTAYGSMSAVASTDDHERRSLIQNADENSTLQEPLSERDQESFSNSILSFMSSGFFQVILVAFACAVLLVALVSKVNTVMNPAVYQGYPMTSTGMTPATTAGASIAATTPAVTTTIPTATTNSAATTAMKITTSVPAPTATADATLTTSVSALSKTTMQSKKSSAVVSLNGISFSLTRVGYATLPYFQSGASAITSYKFLAGYETVIEPYVDMSLTVAGASSDIGKYKYEVCSADNTCYSGSYDVSSGKTVAVNVPCAAYDKLTVTVTTYDTDGNEIEETHTGYAMCMYVRRELRDLTEADLSATMDAMYALWEYEEADGQKKYGENFHSASYFNIAHDFCAGQRDADHIHQGLGFVPQHIKLTNMFEASMQAVNPAVTMPYWDFTMDVAEGKTIYESVMFTEKTFGSMTLPKDISRGFQYKYDDMTKTAIQDGRWAFLKSEVYEDIDSNAFGYLRGPWNMNPSPYISRFATNNAPPLPSCSKYFTGVQNSDYTMFIKWAPFGPHAASHGAVGGVWGCDKLDYLVDSGIIADSSSQKIVCNNWGFFMKELWRNYYITPRTDCSTSSDLSEEGINCGYTCSKAAANDLPATLKDMMVSYVTEEAADNDETWNTMRDFVCYGDAYKVFVGDHLESASTADPSFWPVHPTLERLVQLKYMTGVASAFSWPSTSMDVCDLFQCYENGVKSTHEQCCYGHYESDRLLDFVNRDSTSFIGPTNKETMDGTDPTSSAYTMPYIYNHFTWDHCEEDFAGAIDTMYSMYLKGEITSTGASSGKSPSNPPMLKTTTGTAKTASPPTMTSSAGGVGAGTGATVSTEPAHGRAPVRALRAHR